MFSKELENLIQATLEDGVLEEYEKAALVKRAAAEGVDLTELEIYINSILQKRQRELNEKKNAQYAEVEQKKKEAIGKICPKCGRQVTSLALNCECGYEFKKDKQESAVQLLSEKISQIQSRPLKGSPDSEEWEADRNQRDQEVLDAITLFPVPNTKEDIMDFLALAAPNSVYKGGRFGTIPQRLIIMGILAVVIIIIFAIIDAVAVEDNLQGYLTFIGGIYVIGGAIAGAFLIDRNTLKWNKKAAVWRAKFDQVLMKGRSLRADAEFKQMLDYYEQQVNKK